MKPTEKEEDFIEKLLSEYSWDEGKRIYYQKVAVIALQAIRKAKKEVFDDEEFDIIRDTNKFKKLMERHLSTLQKSKAT